MAAAAPSSAGLSLWAGFVEESLILPGRNPGLFLRAVALIFAHTFVFLSLAVRSAHPAAAALLSLTATGAPPPPSWSRYALLEDDEGDYYPEATSGKVLYHGKTLLLFYLAYVGSKLATLMSARKQEAAVLVGAASLLPLVVYPVYAIALVWGPGDSVWELLGMLPGYLFPSVTVQLYSAVAAAVFYHRFSHHAAIPFTTTKAILI